MYNATFWETPPASTRTAGEHHPAGHWVRVLEPLVKKPGKWARVAAGMGQQHAIVLAHQLRQSKLQVPLGDFEVRAVTVGIEGRVYARFLGDKSYLTGRKAPVNGKRAAAAKRPRVPRAARRV